MTHETYAVILLGAVAFGLLVAMLLLWNKFEDEQHAHHETRLELVIETMDHVATKTRLRATEKNAEQALINVRPLLEKTDWLTGRWHGQFQTLVKLENDRNRAIDTVRKHLFDVPSIREEGIEQVKQGNVRPASSTQLG